MTTTNSARDVDIGTSSFVASIVERYRRYGWTPCEGEWGALQDGYRASFHAALDDADRTNDPTLLDDFLSTMFRSYAVVGLVSINPTSDTVDHIRTRTVWATALWAKRTGGAKIAPLLSAPTIGAPITVKVGEVPIMIDQPRHDAYAAQIVRLLRDVPMADRRDPRLLVVEIGGGYGGLALQLLRRTNAVRVAIIDLPETLYMAGYWLNEVLREARDRRRVAWWDNHTDVDPSADVVLVPAQEREAWTATLTTLDASPVLVCSMHALCEMPSDVGADYLAWLGRSGARWFYHDDAVSTARAEWAETLAGTLAAQIPPDYREIWRDRTPWTGLGDRYGEFLYERQAFTEIEREYNSMMRYHGEDDDPITRSPTDL